MNGLIAELVSRGFSVQLAHDPTETTWESHGDVTLKSTDGKKEWKLPKFQHNGIYKRTLPEELLKTLPEPSDL